MNRGVNGFPQQRRLVVAPPLTGGGSLDDDISAGLDLSFFASLLSGFVPSNNVGDLANDLDFSVGACIDNAAARLIKTSAVITRQLDVAFGSGNGGLSSSLAKTNSTQYHAFAVVRADLQPDIAYDTSPVAANLIADHKILGFRRIHSFRTDGAGAIFPFHALELAGGPIRIVWGSMKKDISAANDTNVATLRPLTTGVPNGVRVEADLQITLATSISTTGTFSHYFSSPDASDEAAGADNNSITDQMSTGGTGTQAISGQFRIWTNAAQQIRTRSNSGGTHDQLWITVRGYLDPRR